MNLGERIKARREALGLSQRELAERIEATAAMVCQMERGTKSPSLQLGYKLAKELEVSMDWLLGIEKP